MKKLYLSITLLGMFILMFMITLVPTQAYTFNGSYDFSNIDLDESLTELNGASLNEIFDYQDFKNLYLMSLPNGVRSKFELNGNQVVFNQYVKEYVLDGSESWIKSSTTAIDRFLVSILDSKPTTILADKSSYTVFQNGVVSSSGTYEIALENTSNKFLIVNFTPFGNTSLIDFKTHLSLNPLHIQYELATPIENLNVTQSLLLYNLENINIDLLNYYFAVWLLVKYNLPVDDLWSYAFTAGNDQGYNDGYNDGQYDWGVLMPDGQTYFDPADAQSYYFNEGRDDAIDNNFTLMGLIELIIGVVLSMVGWIINIEIFNISIIGILSTLAVGIGVIWLLKILRG